MSLPTVSKVVNGRPDVAPDTRALVERLLGERKYQRPGLRRGRRAGLIDLIFNGLDSPWAVEILRGVEDWCSAHTMGATVSAVRHGSARPASWTSTLASHDTDGVILVTSELTTPQLRPAVSQLFPPGSRPASPAGRDPPPVPQQVAPGGLASKAGADVS